MDAFADLVSISKVYGLGSFGWHAFLSRVTGLRLVFPEVVGEVRSKYQFFIVVQGG